MTSAPAVSQPANDTVSDSYDGGTFTVSNRDVSFGSADKKGSQQPACVICDKLNAVAKNRDASSGEWGRLLEWRDYDHVLYRWIMPMVLLQSDGAEGSGISITSAHPIAAKENALRPPRFALYIAPSAALSREAAPSPSVG